MMKKYFEQLPHEKLAEITANYFERVSKLQCENDMLKYIINDVQVTSEISNAIKKTELDVPAFVLNRATDYIKFHR